MSDAEDATKLQSSSAMHKQLLLVTIAKISYLNPPVENANSPKVPLLKLKIDRFVKIFNFFKSYHLQLYFSFH
jgi:hypothetical protein